jgi:hypothetical protein
MLGMIEASTTRSPCRPRTRSRWGTTPGALAEPGELGRATAAVVEACRAREGKSLGVEELFEALDALPPPLSGVELETVCRAADPHLVMPGRPLQKWHPEQTLELLETGEVVDTAELGFGKTGPLLLTLRDAEGRTVRAVFKPEAG